MNTRLVPVLEDTEAVKSSTQYTTNTNISCKLVRFVVEEKEW